MPSKLPSIIILFFISITTQAQPFRIVGYYSLHSAVVSKGKHLPFKLKDVTHVNLWFYNPDTLGNFTEDLSALKKFVDKAHKKNVKVMFSIAGGSPHPYYHRLLADSNRTVFIKNLVSQTTLYNVDGIDVDLEGGDIDDHYEIFVTELAAALRMEHKLITAAVAVYYKDKLTDNALAQFDFVNIMSYDRTGPWRPHEPGPHSDLKAAVSDLDYFGVTRGIPKEKMTLGVPFYGYGFGPLPTSKAVSLNYGNIVKENKGAETADIWKTPEGQTIYYNGIETMTEKTRLAKHRASGLMIWHLRGDAKGKKSLMKAIHVTLR